MNYVSRIIPVSAAVTNYKLYTDSYNLNCQPPSDSDTPVTSFVIGKAVASTPSFSGLIKSIKAGNGGYFEISSTPPKSTPCMIYVGFNNPFCDVGGTLYQIQPNGSYSNTACATATYLDTDTYDCKKCDPTCAACTGPGPNSCLSCGSILPYLFGVTCYRTCPPGSYLSNSSIFPSNTCTCHPTCAACSYSATTGTVSCSACVSSTQYLAGDGTCVDATDCPPLTFANSVSKQCDTTCPTGSVYDTVHHSCSSSCPVGTVKYVSTNTYCYVDCPSKTYVSAISSPPAGTALVQCISCSPPCYECSGPTVCLSCVVGQLFHTDQNQCKSTCDIGYIQDPMSKFSCIPCRNSCSACASGTFLLENKKICVDNCPTGYQSDALTNKCELQTGVFVKILNDTGSSPLNVPTNVDLVIFSEYYSTNNVSKVQWSLSESSAGFSSEFFYLANTTCTALIIRKENLRLNQLYALTLTVTDVQQVSNSAILYILTVSSNITPGTFTISPTIGYGRVTTFGITISNWVVTPSNTPLKFDITTYYERAQNISKKIYFEQMDHARITVASQQQTTFQYNFAPSIFNKTMTVELKAYTQDQIIYQRINVSILVPNSTSADTFQVLLWDSDLTTLGDISRLVELAQYIGFLYPRNETNFYRRYSNTKVNLINTISTLR